jgi:predicted GNAT superfamily acetyltransferase
VFELRRICAFWSSSAERLPASSARRNSTRFSETMTEPKIRPAIVIRDLDSFEDLAKVEAVEKEVWGLSEQDVTPLTIIIATRAAGNIWVGAFDRNKLVGFAFAFLGMEHGQVTIHSHMLAVLEPYRDLDLGSKLKLAQRERALAMRIRQMSWTFDPLQSKNAHVNFCKLGVVSSQYKVDFYGPETSSMLHQNGTDRLWVRWPMATRRVLQRLQGKDPRPEMMDALSRLTPLVRFNGDGAPLRTGLQEALSRQRIAIEIPSDIVAMETKNMELAREWRSATRWAFSEALRAGFFVVEFCRTIRGQQGPGAYLLEKGPIEEQIPDIDD